MSKVVISLGEKVVVLKFGDFGDEVNVDDLTRIDYANLFGEAVTVSALLNRVGLLKAEAEASLSHVKLERDIYGASLARGYRREANITGGKFTMMVDNHPVMIKLTEDSLLQAILLDLAYQNKCKQVINAQRDLAFLDSLYWSVQSKDKKLSVLMRPITPEDFYNELVEGEVNGMLIKKPIDTWTQGSQPNSK